MRAVAVVIAVLETLARDDLAEYLTKMTVTMVNSMTAWPCLVDDRASTNIAVFDFKSSKSSN
jgi:hypothetical protein